MIGGLTTGVTFAATTASSSVVKACVNSHADLALLSKGKCARGYKATTINKQGPTGKRGPTGKTGATGKKGSPGQTGPAGPGAMTNVQNITSGVGRSPDFTVGNIDIQSLCLIDGEHSYASLTMYDTAAERNLYISGTADTLDTDSEVAQPGISVTPLSKGTNVVTQRTTEVVIYALPPGTNATAYVTTHLLVWDGT